MVYPLGLEHGIPDDAFSSTTTLILLILPLVEFPHLIVLSAFQSPRERYSSARLLPEQMTSLLLASSQTWALTKLCYGESCNDLVHHNLPQRWNHSPNN